MKTRLLLLFIIFPAIVFSQTKVTGKVLDKETQKPVSDVIIHSSGKISITNDKGEYDFEINQPETVYFRHLSYSSFKIQSDSLQNNGVVYLTANVTELSEVVISPNRANYLLNKAIDNLFANFQKAKSKMYYLTHVEENTTKGGEREVYALIETFLDRVRNDKKRFFNWDVKLIWLDRTKIMVENDFSVGGKDFSVSFFPEYIRFSSGKTKKDTATFFSEVYDENSDYWIIKVYTQYPDKRHYHYFLYTISRQDTVLTEIIAQSYSNSEELTTENFKGVNYSESNDFAKYKFSKNVSDLYYLEQFQFLSHLKIMDNAPYEMIRTVLAHTVDISPDKMENEKKKRMLFIDSYYLYKSKLPDSPGFWKKYVKP